MAVTDLKESGNWAPGSGAKRYVVDWYDSGKKRRRQRFRLKAEADNFAASLRVDTTGLRDRTKAAAKSVDDVHAEWIKWLSVHGGRSHDGAAPSTIGGYESIHSQWISPELGSIRLGRLDRETVGEWRTTMVSRDGADPSARQRGVADDQLVRLLDWCIDQGYLGENPAKTLSGGRAPRPKSRKIKKHIYLTSRQVWRLAAFAPDVVTRNIILVMANTGLRFGEVAALCVEDFDQDTGELSVSKALALDHGQVYQSRTKSHETRVVTIGGWTLNLLADLVESKKPSDRIFTTLKGKDLNRDNWASRKFEPAAASASTAIRRLQDDLGVNEYRKGLSWFGPITQAALDAVESTQTLQDVLRTPGEWVQKTDQFSQAEKIIYARSGDGGFQVLRYDDIDFHQPTPHDLRHTAASHAIRSGATVLAVQRMLGHADAKMTLNTYSGLWDDDMTRLGVAMANALSMPTDFVPDLEEQGEVES